MTDEHLFLDRDAVATPRWISTNGPIRVPSPIEQPYRLANEYTTTSSPEANVLDEPVRH